MAGDETIGAGDPTALAADLAEGVARLASAIMRFTPDMPERDELAKVLRRLGDHVHALGRPDVQLPIELAWVHAIQPRKD